MDVRTSRDPNVRNRLLATQREVSLARLLLCVADRVARKDRDQEFTELYNDLKSMFEGIVRDGK